MKPSVKPTPLTPYARPPRGYRTLRIITSTVDAYGRVHWLLADPRIMVRSEWYDNRPFGGRVAPEHAPYDAVVVTVDDGDTQETRLSAVGPRSPRIDALPDGGFVLADARSAPDEQHVQVFDALGRPSWTFRVGDGIEYLLADESGDLWAGYFDEGVFGHDPLSWPGLRRWSSTGEALWRYAPAPGTGGISDIYALNVGKGVAWACPYHEFPLLEIVGDEVRTRTSPVRSAHGLAVHGDRIVFVGGRTFGALTECRLTQDAAVPVAEGLLVHEDGSPLRRHRRVCRGPRVYIQDETTGEWSVLDISGDPTA